MSLSAIIMVILVALEKLLTALLDHVLVERYRKLHCHDIALM